MLLNEVFSISVFGLFSNISFIKLFNILININFIHIL